MGGESGPGATTAESTDATATDAGEADTTDTASGDGSDAETTDSGSGDELPADLRREDGGLVVDYPRSATATSPSSRSPRSCSAAVTASRCWESTMAS